MEFLTFTEVDHDPKPHPASPSSDLPNSFASYRKKAQQHGPLGGGQQTNQASGSGLLESRTGASLGTVMPKEGEYFDRSELPSRFRRTAMTVVEIEAIESGGASVW